MYGLPQGACIQLTLPALVCEARMPQILIANPTTTLFIPIWHKIPIHFHTAKMELQLEHSGFDLSQKWLRGIQSNAGQNRFIPMPQSLIAVPTRNARQNRFIPTQQCSAESIVDACEHRIVEGTFPHTFTMVLSSHTYGSTHRLCVDLLLCSRPRRAIVAESPSGMPEARHRRSSSADTAATTYHPCE